MTRRRDAHGGSSNRGPRQKTIYAPETFIRSQLSLARLVSVHMVFLVHYPRRTKNVDMARFLLS